MEAPAAEVVNEINDTDNTAYDQLWSPLSRCFGDIQEERENMHRFDHRKQLPGETVAEYEQALKTLHRQAWPQATAAQDSVLKRRFEDGLASQEMINYLRLHARKDNFPETVKKSRQFETQLSPKKSVKLVTPDTPAVNILQTGSVQDILNGIETVVEKVLAKQNVKRQRQRPEQAHASGTHNRQNAPLRFNAGWQRSPPPMNDRPRPQPNHQQNNDRPRFVNRQSFMNPRQFTDWHGRLPAWNNGKTCHTSK